MICWFCVCKNVIVIAFFKAAIYRDGMVEFVADVIMEE